MKPDPAARDALIRQAAFDHVRQLALREGILTHEMIKEGFIFEGRRWPLINPQRGIFKPSAMPYLLSIRTVVPRKGGRVWYDDQRKIHRQIFAVQEQLDYAFMGTDPHAAENQWLKEAAERQVPIIYFLGVSPGRYQAIIPTFIVDWDPGRLPDRKPLAPHPCGPEINLHKARARIEAKLKEAGLRSRRVEGDRVRCRRAFAAGTSAPLLCDGEVRRAVAGRQIVLDK